MNNKYQENLEALDNARLTINKLCGKWLPREVLDNLEEYGDYELYNYVKYSVFKELVDKETPKKVTHQATIHSCCTCPNCLNVIDEFEDFRGQRVRDTFDYCRFCGQKIDWSNENE